jgi:hypothetical protein
MGWRKRGGRVLIHGPKEIVFMRITPSGTLGHEGVDLTFSSVFPSSLPSITAENQAAYGQTREFFFFDCDY